MAEFGRSLKSRHVTFKPGFENPPRGAIASMYFANRTLVINGACRRDTSTIHPVSALILRTGDGIPFQVPEVALLFNVSTRGHLSGVADTAPLKV
jgi:hypothetical protein